MKKSIIFLHTGSNLGNRIANLQLANGLIKRKIGLIDQYSRYYHTKAWGVTDQPDFINQALKVETTLSPFGVLEKIQDRIKTFYLPIKKRKLKSKRKKEKKMDIQKLETSNYKKFWFWILKVKY